MLGVVALCVVGALSQSARLLTLFRFVGSKSLFGLLLSHTWNRILWAIVGGMGNFLCEQDVRNIWEEYYEMSEKWLMDNGMWERFGLKCQVLLILLEICETGMNYGASCFVILLFGSLFLLLGPFPLPLQHVCTPPPVCCEQWTTTLYLFR